MLQLLTCHVQQSLINSHKLSLRARSDAQTLWMMTGLAVRSAQRLGLHREKALRSFSVFEAEMRRRLWWQIIMLESHAAKLCGVIAHAGPGFPWDAKRPMNINDGDLHPDMREAPKEHVGVTEMLLCSTRYEIGAFNIAHANNTGPTTSVECVDAEIERLRQSLEDRLLKFCDPAIPLHFMALNIAKGALCRMRLAARLPHVHAAKDADLPPDERDMLFRLCLELVEQANAVTTSQSVQKYQWHVNPFFPLDALVFMLSDMAYRNPSFDVSENLLSTAWHEMDIAYELQPRLLQDDSNAMYAALRSLAIKAWERYRVSSLLPTPKFIEVLYTKKAAGSHQAGGSRHLKEVNPSSHGCDRRLENDTSNSSLLPSGTAVPEDPSTWPYWQQVLGGLDDPLGAQPYGVFQPLLFNLEH